MNEEQAAGPRSAVLNQEAIDWAWAQPIENDPGARIVLLCLARRVDEMWEWTARQEEVAVEALVPARSVRRYLERLEEGGFVVRTKHVDEKGLRLPDTYRLNPSYEPVANMASGPVANLASGSDQGVYPVANLASGDVIQWPDWPVDAETRRSEPVANLATGQESLWPDWPVEPPDDETPSSGPVANLADGKSGTRESSSSKKKNKEKTSSSSGIVREDVELLCSRLLDWLAKKDYRKRPTSVPDAWRTEARLLLDKDGVDLQEALAVLDWSQRDRFWSKNVHAMPKFRDQYGQLEFKSRDSREGSPAATGTDGRPNQLPAPMPARVGGYDKARNFGRRNQS